MSNFPPDVIAAAQASHAKYFPLGPYASVSLAQWAIESAYGRAMSGKNNPFGIKATPDQINAGQASVRWTKEYYGGQYHNVEQYFADYPDMTGAFDAHAKLLATSPIYVEAQHATNVLDYVTAMAKHYATAPNYASVIMGIIHSALLTQYDSDPANVLYGKQGAEDATMDEA